MGKRPFYTHPQPGDERWSNSFDLLFRGQELVTGGQRLHRHSDYLAAIRARGEDPAAYSDYLEAFAHGMPPHGGFAIGLERWTGRAHRGREHPGGHAVPPGPAPPDALGPGHGGSRVDVEASGYLVVPPVFKTGERALRRWRVRFPSASATCASPCRAGAGVAVPHRSVLARQPSGERIRLIAIEHDVPDIPDRQIQLTGGFLDLRGPRMVAHQSQCRFESDARREQPVHHKVVHAPLR